MARETTGGASIGATTHKGCNSSSCCSPAKLWRTLQTLIKADDKKGLNSFFKDARLEHIVRVALTSRISNDASMFPPSQQHKLIRLNNHTQAMKYLGKSYSDLNSLQLALITSSESMVLALLAQLKLHASPQELKHYINHVWGQGNTSLHLAVYLKRHLVVKTFLDLGCTFDHLNARNKNVIDCYDGDQNMMDLLLSTNKSHNKKQQQQQYHDETTVPMETTTIPVPEVITKQPTMLIVDKQEEEQKSTIVPLKNEIVIVNNNSISPQLQKEATTTTKVDDPNYYLLMKQQHIVNKTILPVHITNNILMMKKQAAQFVSLAQLKKPPDIISSYYHSYASPIMATTTCCY